LARGIVEHFARPARRVGSVVVEVLDAEDADDDEVVVADERQVRAPGDERAALVRRGTVADGVAEAPERVRCGGVDGIEHLAWRIPRVTRTMGLGPIGAGVIVAMVMLVTLWFVGLPFGFVEQWWAARHGLAPHDYVSWIFAPWTTLSVEAVFALVTVALVMS